MSLQASFGDVLSDQPARVFVRPAFPRVVWAYEKNFIPSSKMIGSKTTELQPKDIFYSLSKDRSSTIWFLERIIYGLHIKFSSIITRENSNRLF